MTRSKSLLLTVSSGLLLATLAACSSVEAPSKLAAAPPATAVDQWTNRVQVNARPEEILLAPHPQGLSETQLRALDGLLGQWLRDEGGEILVSAPVGSEAAGRLASAARLRLVGQGAPSSAVRIVGYDAGGDPSAPLRVGYLRHEATIPKCGQYWENLAATRTNGAYENFGCAMAANLAAQIADPEDLVRPRDSTPSSAARRDTVLDKYRKGEVTSSAKDEQAAGAVAKAVK